MSKININQYYTTLDRAAQFSKSTNEDTIKSYFWMLLNEYAHKNDYEVSREMYCRGTRGNKVKPDGILKNRWGLDVGYWESKDEKDVIDDEIDAKIKKGYPLSNTLFEDSQTAVLFQRGEEVSRISVRDADKLHDILTRFISYKSESVHKFEDALVQFKNDIPAILETLRKRIDEAGKNNAPFIAEQSKFLKLCKVEINPDITLADIREMMIQHILTSDIFNKVFDDSDFHRHNTVAAELEKLVNALFTYSERKNLLGSIEHYYDAINAAAAGIADHHERQKFLKVLYENFYKIYNPKAADRLGVIYTPNEIVKFMVASTDYLLHKHFGKTLADKNVDILDPATGTGTFICDIIEHIPNHQLAYKYKNELHANEVAILPYYVANLNIEYTFKQNMGYYEEFPNICFVDTLDNVAALHYKGKQEDIFGLSSENTERIRRQNKKKISVIIGNPPYNANQKNENENNKNREYPAIDTRIKDTYIKNSTAQKTKMYDMYARFLRWASDRVDKNGIVAFVSNSSFIDTRTYDGFRKVAAEEFNEIHIVDLKGNARTSGERRRKEGGNVFSDLIRVGVAVYFLVRKEGEEGCKIYYNAVQDYAKAEEKKEYLRVNKFERLPFEKITPDKTHNWINLSENDWEELMPLCDKDVKLGRKKEGAIFELFTLGTVSNRDEWVYDFDKRNLERKIDFFVNQYNTDLKKHKGTAIEGIAENSPIKYTRDLKKRFANAAKLEIDKSEFRKCLYRVFTEHNIYYDAALNEMRYQTPLIFPNADSQNQLIALNVGNKPFNILASKHLVDLHFNGDSQCLPLYRYDSAGNRTDNITDWGLEQFRDNYKDEKIKKEDIFHYVYAVLHNPAYRKKYEINLKREFPRIPFYNDFQKWAAWGKKLMELHIGYEAVEPYPLNIISSGTKSEHKKVIKDMFEVREPQAMFAYQPKIKVKLKADKERGLIEIDDLTTISGIPKEAWEYKLGNRSALEWILDQYKEKKPSDPTIAEKFNTYRFADYKDKVIDLLKRVCTVSVETMKLIKEMEEIGVVEGKG